MKEYFVYSEINVLVNCFLINSLKYASETHETNADVLLKTCPFVSKILSITKSNLINMSSSVVFFSNESFFHIASSICSFLKHDNNIFDGCFIYQTKLDQSF